MRSLYLFSSIFAVICMSACNKDGRDSFNLDCDDPDSGLILHYSFDEQSGTIATDCTANKFNGLLDGVSWAILDGERTAVEFDGQDSLVIPSFITEPGLKSEPEHGTISVTFKFRSFDGDIQPLFYYGESDPGSPHNSMIAEVGHKMDPDDRKLYFTIVNKRFCFDSNENLEENKWYHFVAVVSTTGNTGYLNGVEMTNRHYNLGSDSTYTDFFKSVPTKELFTLGYGRYGMCDDFFHFNGYISDFRVYNRALSSLEVNELYNNQFHVDGTLMIEK
jgi:hypothetical protein